MNHPFSFVNINNPDRHLNLREALNAILADQRASREQLADDLHISLAQLDIILEASDPADLEECVAALPYDGEGWVSVSPNEGDAFEPDDVGQWGRDRTGRRRGAARSQGPFGNHVLEVRRVGAREP
jgi:hypothetical protein